MNPSIQIGEWLLTPASHRLERGDTAHVLRPKLVEVLVCLAQEPGRVFERDELLDRIWPGIVVTDDSITRAISDLRKLLEDSAETPRYIETIRKGGYRLIAPVGRPEPAAAVFHRRWKERPMTAAAGLTLALGLVLWGPTSAPVPAAVRPAEPRPFTTLVGRETDPAVSPDGERVAFAWGGVRNENYDIYVKRIGADAPVRLTDGPAADVHPAWSPDGQRVAFLRASRDGSGVFIVPEHGGEPEQVCATSTWVQGLDWSPDGGTLVFAGREDDRGGFRIRRLALDEPEAVPVSTPPAQHTDHSPVFSPDGATIAFVRSSVRCGRDQVVLVDATGGDPRTLELEGLAIRGLDWVADDEHLILAAVVGETARLFRMRVADGELTEIPVHEEQVTYPSLSRDGRTLIYEDARPRQRLHRVRLGGGDAPEFEPILVTTHTERDADFSPDGTRLAFVSDRSGALELWLADSDGERPERLTDSGPDGIGRPRWSPDGERIAYLRLSPAGSSL